MSAPTQKFLSPEQTVLTDIGPCLHDEGVTYRVWALGHVKVVVHIESSEGDRTLELEGAKNSGYFFGTDAQGKAGDLYKISIDGAAPIPDFVSHFQPKGVFGPSQVIDSGAYQWKATDWKRPAWNGQVIYECHIGTFTREGTYQAAIAKLDHLVDLGITALEIMPVAEFAGERNWGYDGVLLFSPAHAYGHPDDLRALIDACHLRGIAAILDVVYNHLGPEGNYSHQYSDFFFHEGKDNPWGQNFNCDGPNSEPVRAMIRQNTRYWLDSFRFDGFRMDATHAVHDESAKHILSEVAAIVHSKGGFIIAEDDRNARSVLEAPPGGWGFDALWSDDYHHSMRVSQTGEQQYFLKMFKGSTAEIGKVLEEGWLYCGQHSIFHDKPRGTPVRDFAPQQFVYCISNHDQVGNRWQGERLHTSVRPESYRAMSLFHCLIPYTPLIFMGQEWSASAPFHYFTDMSPELGKLITKGRGEEFLKMEFVTDPKELEKMAGPQEKSTFEESILNWAELSQPEHARMLDLYRNGLKLRRELFGNVNPPRETWKVEADTKRITVLYSIGKRRILLELALEPGASKPLLGPVLLRSNDPRFSGTETTAGPETILMEIE
jgi:maltooligosyltrehalose trehalohydrolase